MPLFVVLAPGEVLDDALKARIVQQIRTKASARHVPNEIYQVAEIPRTLTGKKMEVPVRKLLLGAAPDKVASADAMANPKSIAFFVRMAEEMKTSEATYLNRHRILKPAKSRISTAPHFDRVTRHKETGNEQQTQGTDDHHARHQGGGGEVHS
jgi:hypothetical protein